MAMKEIVRNWPWRSLRYQLAILTKRLRETFKRQDGR